MALHRVAVWALADVASHHVHRCRYWSKISKVGILIFALYEIERPIFRPFFDVPGPEERIPYEYENPIDEVENPSLGMIIVSR